MQQLPHRYLHPGEMIFTRELCQIVTVLGSCVALTLFSVRLRAAAICHVTLPEAPSGRDPGGKRFRFASDTIPEMLSRFRAIGVKSSELEARVFGGSSRISAHGKQSIYPVGRANLERVRQLLQEACVPIRQQDAGAPGSLRLVFDTGTGQVHVSRLSNPPQPPNPLSR